jgi:hypothetical protein
MTKKEIYQALAVNKDPDVSAIMEELKSLKEVFMNAMDTINVQKEQIQSLQHDCIVRDKRIRQLEVRTNIVEQRLKKKIVIVSDLDLRTFGEVARGDVGTAAAPNGSEQEEDDRKKERFVDFAASKLDHQMNISCIEAVYQLRDKRVLVKLANTDDKLKLMAARRRIRTNTNYINDHMTKAGGEIAKRCRELRKGGSIEYTWTKLGKIFVKVTKTSKTIEVQCTEDVDKVLNG